MNFFIKEARKIFSPYYEIDWPKTLAVVGVSIIVLLAVFIACRNWENLKNWFSKLVTKRVLIVIAIIAAFAIAYVFAVNGRYEHTERYMVIDKWTQETYYVYGKWELAR